MYLNLHYGTLNTNTLNTLNPNTLHPLKFQAYYLGVFRASGRQPWREPLSLRYGIRGIKFRV